jgi:hypothetical protein
MSLIGLGAKNSINDVIVNKYGTYCGMKIGGETEILGENPLKFLCVRHKSHII